jgi:hypothetical protein
MKESVGDYVTSATLSTIEAKIDTKLAERDTSIKEIKTLFLADKDGRVSGDTILTNAKEFARDYVAMQLERAQAKMVEKIDTVTAQRTNKTQEELAQIRKELDQNGDGDIGKAEMKEAIEARLREATVGMKEETRVLARQLVADTMSGSMSKDQFQAEITKYKGDMAERLQKLWESILAILGVGVSGYAGKQIFSVKSHAQTKERLAVVEKLMNGGMSGGPKPLTSPAPKVEA